MGQKRKIRKMDVILAILAGVGVAFTCEMISLYRETGGIPDTLVAGVFAILGGECGAMAWIKTTEERRQDREWQLQDQAREEQKEKEAKTPKE